MRRVPNEPHDNLEPVSKLHKLGLASLVKEIRVIQPHRTGDYWFEPPTFSRRDLRHFSAFTNVQTLTLENVDISRFMPDIDRYFGHLSPTLRSIVLAQPRCTPRQLSSFLSPFSNLDDIYIYSPVDEPTGPTPLGPKRTPDLAQSYCTMITPTDAPPPPSIPSHETDHHPLTSPPEQRRETS